MKKNKVSTKLKGFSNKPKAKSLKQERQFAASITRGPSRLTQEKKASRSESVCTERMECSCRSCCDKWRSAYFSLQNSYRFGY